jgi:hypothetical protein
MDKDDYILVPIPYASEQHLFSEDEIHEMHAGIKYCGKLKEYFEETKEKLIAMHINTEHQHSDEEIEASAAVLLTWPFLGKTVLDEETVFSHAEIILSLVRDDNLN